jgi:hypothetical protein
MVLRSTPGWHSEALGELMVTTVDFSRQILKRDVDRMMIDDDLHRSQRLASDVPTTRM